MRGPICVMAIFARGISDSQMSSSFHNADRRTHRRVILVGFLFCAAFVMISYFARPLPDNDHVLVKADKLVRIAGKPIPAN
jgi:hypothetical protein